MSETVFQVVTRIFETLAGTGYALCLCALFRPFLQNRRKMAVIFAVYMLVYLAGNFVTLLPNGSVLPVTVLLLVLSGRLGTGPGLTFLLAAVFFGAKISGALAIGSVHYILTEAFFPQFTRLEILQLWSALSMAMILLLHIVLLAVMVLAVRRQLLRRPLELQAKSLCYLSLFPAAGILFGGMIAGILFEIQDGVFLQLYQRHPAFLLLVPLLAALFYAGTYAAIAFHQQMAVLQEEKETCFVQRQQVRAIQERMDEVDRFYSRVRQVRHDLRGHLINIKGLAQGGSYEDMEAYIARMDESIRDLELSVHTGNAVTDVIISDRQKEAARQGTGFRSDFRYPASGGYDAYDIGIILHNLLQNALEACAAEERGFISLAGRQKKKFFLIEVKNTFSGALTLDSRTGLPVTAKTEERGFHGLGLSNVRQEVEKYMGDMEVKAENGEFCVTVLLQERISEMS